MKFKILIVLFIFLALLVIYMFAKNNKIPSNVGMNGDSFQDLKSSPNGVSSQDSGDKYVEAINVMGNPKNDFERLIKICDDLWNMEIIKEDENYVHMVITTSGMKFKDDIQIYYNLEKNIFEYWSQSRIGYSDMGLNMERYNSLFKEYINNEEEVK
ncbi:MAG: DUF1499 domain-containing protein [Firmicutes bacterium]|nr:DUF1499 domain-containing protein [Bacillota bacterium]